MWLHLVVVKYCLVVQQDRNCDQSSSQMLGKLDEFVVLHILIDCNTVTCIMHQYGTLYMYKVDLTLVHISVNVV